MQRDRFNIKKDGGRINDDMSALGIEVLFAFSLEIKMKQIKHKSLEVLIDSQGFTLGLLHFIPNENDKKYFYSYIETLR